MKFITTLFLSIPFALFFSCNNPIVVDRISLDYEVITDSIFTRMPGSMIRVDKYVAWHDPFTSNGFLHVVDTEQKNEVAVLGTIGQGPLEFTTPVLAPTFENRIVVYDVNSPKLADLSLGSDLPFQLNFSTKTGERNVSRMIEIAPDQWVSLISNKEIPLQFTTDKGSSSFGKAPLEVPSTVENRFDFFQGHLVYNSHKRLLIYSPMDYKYFASYKLNSDNTFDLKDEKRFPVEYSIVDNRIKLSKENPRGGLDMVATKEYVVQIERDTENDPTEVTGMDFTKLPQTLFLYDYEGNLRKIAHIGIPMLRLAGSCDDNTVYAIGINPDFCLIRIELGE